MNTIPVMRANNEASADLTVLTKRGGITLVLALSVNLVLAWLFLSAEIPGSTEFFQYGPIALWTTLGVVGATAVYYFLTKRSETPNRSFTLIAVVVLVLSFLPDVGLALFVDDVTTSEAVSLMVLHVPPAVICIAVLTGWLFNR